MVLLFVKSNFLFNPFRSRVFFVASVPGVHRGLESDKWGHRRLGHLLKKHATIPSLLSPSESNVSWPVIAQCSSIGTLGAGPDAWMCGELRTSLSQRAALPGDMLQPPPKFKVVSHFKGIILLGCDRLSLGESFSLFLQDCCVFISKHSAVQEDFFHSFPWHLQNAMIPCRSREPLPFLSVTYFFLPPFSTNYSSILSHLILSSISWPTSQSCCSRMHIQYPFWNSLSFHSLYVPKPT